MYAEISPLDGRYRSRLEGLGQLFSEAALMQARTEVELRYLLAQEGLGLFEPFSAEENARIQEKLTSFGPEDHQRIKSIEGEIRHDVKAVEVYLGEVLGLREPNRIHFALTSEDVNKLALGMLLRAYRDQHQLPQLRELVETLVDAAEQWKGVAFPARTHGQPASPTTLGKELSVFISRLLRQVRQLEALTFTGKLNGATGTYSAFDAAFPGVDWPAFSRAFVESLGLAPNPCTTQIEGYDSIAEYLAITSRVNGIVLDLDLDAWTYISHGDLIQRSRPGEVGSSTMPHKVNPIRFENSEGNLTLSTGLIHTLTEKLSRSRMQRDLSDMTVRRNIGVALAHAHLAIGQTIAGLEEIGVDASALQSKVDASPEVLAEAYQTILRAAGTADPYGLLKTATRGKSVTLEALHAWIDELPVDRETQAKMKALTPSGYLGRAAEICQQVVDEARTWLAASAQ